MNEKQNLPKRGNMSGTLRNRLLDKNNKPTLLLSTILNDSNLDIQLRDNYLNIYYRGGNILCIHPRSFTFDKFYFYLPDNEGYPKTYVEKMAKGKRDEIPQNTTHKVPTEEDAKKIMQELDAKCRGLKSLLDSQDYLQYFEKAKAVMDEWFKKFPKKERNDQHYISLANREFSHTNNLIAIDLEFSVSKNQPYNKNTDGKTKVCRFDIIAVSKSGQLYVIELKQNQASNEKDKPANIEEHKADFENTVGNDRDNVFLNEMADLLNTKKNLGILGNDIEIDITKKPIFAVAYSGKEADKFNREHEKAGYTVIKINDNKKLSL